MGTRIVLSLIFIFTSLAGCRSPQSLEPSAKEATSYIVPLENVMATWDEYLKDIHNRAPANHASWSDDLNHLCSRQENMCDQGGSKGSKKKSSAVQNKWVEVKKLLKEENFEELTQYSVDTSLKFFGRSSKSQLIEYSEILLKDANCKTSDMRHALASMLEDHLPEEIVKTHTLALYETNSQCPAGRTQALSSYRAAMLRLLEKDCTKALPLLDKVTTSTEEHLKPRSMYWSWKCQGESPTVKSAATSQLPYFSYHRLLMEEAKTDGASQAVVQAPLLEQTPTMMESVRQPLLNDFIRLAEKMLANQEPNKARVILEKVKLERIQESEPEFQVFWAYMLHNSQSGIRKFQVLSSIINAYPQYRSKTVKNMLFPNSFFEQVEASSKKLDPWLVQALIRQESAFDPRARSRVGATGLMQLMPATARKVARINRNQLKDPVQNVQAGVKFLERLVDKFGGQVHLALAAYNAGPNKVEEWVKRYPTSDTMLFVDSIPYRETREYVAFILRNYHWYRSLNPVPTPNSEEVSDPDSMLTLFY